MAASLRPAPVRAMLCETAKMNGHQGDPVPTPRPTQPETLPKHPLIVPGCGHFLRWQRVDVLNQVTTFFFAGLQREASR